MGNAYIQGWGVPVDIWQAIAWYERAAERGSIAADINLGGIYERGRGMLRNPEKARFHRERASRSGTALARQQAQLQEHPLYRWMNGQNQVDWLRVRAEAKDNDLEAQRVLGKAYLQGNPGLLQSFPNAQHWFLKAAAQGDPESMNNVGYTLYRGFLGEADFAAARSWFEKAARAGFSNSMVSLAQMNERGEAGKRDPKKALDWLLKAAAASNPQAIARLAAVYRNGELGQKSDPKRAAYWEAQMISAPAKDKP